MRRIAIGGVLAAVFVSAAGAADLPVKTPVYSAPPPVQAFSWTGCYVGGHVGGIKNDSNLTSHTAGAVTAAQVAATTYSYDGDDTSFTGGVQYGCNYQTGSWVFGLDSSFSWAGIDESFNAFHPAVPGVLAYNETVSQQADWYSTTRVRLGWAYDRWMFFVQGGSASTRVDSTYAADFIPFGGAFTWAGSKSKNRFGWTVGGGLEYALSQNWFLRGEYLYVDFGDFTYESYTANNPTQIWQTEVDTSFHVARIALSYRFTRSPSLLQWAMGGFQY